MNAERADLIAIEELTAAFYGAFTNRGGADPDIDRLHELFMPDAIIVKTAWPMQVYGLADFIAPRQAILTNGKLTEFCEEEVSAKTEIFGNIAHRFSRYRKSWVASGKQFEVGGAKSIQFARTADGWKIASLTWDDDPVVEHSRPTEASTPQ